MRKKLTSIMVAALLAATVYAPSAEALQAAEVGVSLPYVEDVNPSGGGYVATVSCAGPAKAKLRVTLKGRSVKVRKVGTRLWLVKIKRGKLYKLSVRADGQRRVIGYKVL